MTLEEFLKLEHPEIEHFLELEHPEKYDFSNDGASTLYQVITDPIEKYIIYKSKKANRWTDEKKGVVYPKGKEFSESIKKIYEKINDPDSESPLLQKIYDCLWDNEYLQFCKQKKKIKPDTMNSAQTTLSKTMDQFNIMTDCEPKLKRSMKNSVNRLIHFYALEGDNLSNQLSAVGGLCSFLSLYHTLGNFIPAPFNDERNAPTKDYWDLTLLHLYNWYNPEPQDNKITHLERLFGKKNKIVVERCEKWLEAFGSWGNFVEKNYLQDFVNIYPDGNYGMPKELWAGHFLNGKLPKNDPEEEIKQFYTNASSWILARSNRMLLALKEKTTNKKE